MRKWLLALCAALLVAEVGHAANLTGYWFTPSIKVARQDFYPNGTCSTCTITRNWDGTTAKMFGAKGELVSGWFYLLNNSGADATSVSVTISSFTGPGGQGIVPVVVSSNSVWNSSTFGPVNLFYVRYVPIRGETQNSWDPTEYEARDLPLRFQVPYTVNANNDGIPTPATQLWKNRPDHDKFYPEIMVPMEEVRASSFTVAKSSSQAIGMDVYISSGLLPGTYTATLTVMEGVTVSTTIPVQLLVYNFTMPAKPSLKVLAAVGVTNINVFHYNNEFIGQGSAQNTTMDHYYQLMWRHGLIPIGDDEVNIGGDGTKDYPTSEYRKMLDGSLFTNANGFGNSMRINSPVPFYMVGTYANWNNPTYWSTSTITGGATAFCTNVSSWSVNLGIYPGLRAALYLEDEPPDADLVSPIDKWAVWMSTVCPMSGTFMNSWVTSHWTHVASSAPHVNMPATTDWIGSGFPNSNAKWASLATLYQTTGSTQAWAYNGHESWDGSMFATEDDGISPMVFALADWKKGVQGHFLWEVVNWKNSNNTPNPINDLFNDAKTFGGDVYPSTDAIKGRYGFSYSNGDGVLLFPGHDTQDAANDYNFDGPIASMRLKLVKDGINLYDYATLAFAINPSSTTAIVNTLVPEVLWEHKCFNDVSGVDCSFSYGGRQWSQDPNYWETQREALAQIIAGAVTDAKSVLTPGSVVTGNSQIQ